MPKSIWLITYYSIRYYTGWKAWLWFCWGVFYSAKGKPRKERWPNGYVYWSGVCFFFMHLFLISDIQVIWDWVGYGSLVLVLDEDDYRTVTRDSSATIDWLPKPEPVSKAVVVFSTPFETLTLQWLQKVKKSVFLWFQCTNLLVPCDFPIFIFRLCFPNRVIFSKNFRCCFWIQFDLSLVQSCALVWKKNFFSYWVIPSVRSSDISTV